MAPGSDPALGRRRFMQAGVGLAVGLGWLPAFGPRAEPLRAGLDEQLASSPFVYVSPLRANGGESRCHGEVWYGWIDGSVVLITAGTTWKARALARGLDRARIWVGDHGTWKRWWGTSSAFRDSPFFEARAEAVRNDGLMERLMALYQAKYPEEVADWEPRMREGYRSGERVLLRYHPQG